MQKKRVHLSTRLWGKDRTDVGICTTDAQIYHVWHKTENKGETVAVRYDASFGFFPSNILRAANPCQLSFTDGKMGFSEEI